MRKTARPEFPSEVVSLFSLVFFLALQGRKFLCEFNALRTDNDSMNIPFVIVRDFVGKDVLVDERCIKYLDSRAGPVPLCTVESVVLTTDNKYRLRLGGGVQSLSGTNNFRVIATQRSKDIDQC